MNTTTPTVRAVEAANRGLHIEPHIYAAIAQEMLDKIGDRNCISTSIEVEDGDLYFRFTLSALIYHQTVRAPEGTFEVISNVVPVWWELHSFLGEEEVLNDATFDELKGYLIE